VTKRSVLALAILAGAQLTCAEAQSSPDDRSEPTRSALAQGAGERGTSAAEEQAPAPTSELSSSEPLESVVVSGHFLDGRRSSFASSLGES